MKFSEYVQMLYPILGDGCEEFDFVIRLIGSIVKEKEYTDEVNSKKQKSLLDEGPEYLKRIYNGTRNIAAQKATSVTSNLDKDKFYDYISSFSEHTLERVDKALKENEIITDGTTEDIAEKCADILIEILENIAKIKEKQNQPKSTETSKDSIEESLDKLNQILKSCPQPKELPVPSDIEEHEQPYIKELYLVYGEIEGIKDFNHDNLLIYEDHEDDFKDRRIDYFAAESIRRGLSEVFDGKHENQFDILKEEMYAGVKNTHRKRYPDGYERLLSVMEQATTVEVNKYWLSRSPFWISNNIRMGTCHFLVNDERLKWVK